MNVIYTGKSKVIRRICEILNQCVQQVYINGVEQPKTNGAVDITVPSATSQLENDSGFVTGDAISGKVDKVDGKGLSANDFTDVLLDKLNGIAEGATKVMVDTALSDTSTNPVQNQTVKAALDGKAAASHKHSKSDITDFPSALKNPNALTVQFNGTTNKTYDGSAAVTVNITPDGIGAAASSHGTHVTYSTASPKANGTASAGTAATVARSDHIHPVQTSVSGSAGSATKLDHITLNSTTIDNTPGSFAFSGNGAPFSGTDWVGLQIGDNVDKFQIRAANNQLYFRQNDSGGSNVDNWKDWITFSVDGHTHSYAGSSGAGGAATSAVKLQTARTINGTSFDGTSNINVPILSSFALGDSADLTTYPWFKIATATTKSTYADLEAMILVDNTYGTSQGLLKIRCRTEGTAGVFGNTRQAYWELADTTLDVNKFVLVCIDNSSTGTATVELWCNMTSRYNSYSFVFLDQTSRTKKTTTDWTLHNPTSGSASYTAGTYAVVSSLRDIKNSTAGNAATATKLKTARTLTIGDKGKSFDGSANVSFTLDEIGAAPASAVADTGWKNLIYGATGAVRYRKIGSLVEITGQYKPSSNGGGFTLGTIPEGYRPSLYTAEGAFSNPACTQFYKIAVTKDGVVTVSGNGLSAFTANITVNLHLMYFVD